MLFRSLNTFSFVSCLYVDLCILCVKMKTFLCEESVLRHNKRNCFPSYLDHYLNETPPSNKPPSNGLDINKLPGVLIEYLQYFPRAETDWTVLITPGIRLGEEVQVFH